jgi:hypothetical protein
VGGRSVGIVRSRTKATEFSLAFSPALKGPIIYRNFQLIDNDDSEIGISAKKSDTSSYFCGHC